jgi:hypothetical protein
MAVVAVREVTGRSLSHQFGESPTAERKFIATLDGPNTPTQEIIAATGVFHLASHPEYSYMRMTNASVTEATPTPFHAEVTFSYSVPPPDELDPNPLTRPAVWSFSTSGASVPAYYYYEGTGNGTLRPLVNTAKDFFEGAMMEESEVRATIQRNLATFPLVLAAQVTNCVNSDSYLGAPAYHWKCGGISAQQANEVVNDEEIRYWQVTAELAYRQTGWTLQLPNVGYNYLLGGVKERAYVIDPESKDKVACSSPIALTESGDIEAPGTFPTILSRRVHKAIAFSSLFGSPPP